MKQIKVIYNQNNNGILTTIITHTNWPVAYGLIRAHICSHCHKKMKPGDKTIEIIQTDMRRTYENIIRRGKVIDYYCASCVKL